MTPSLKRRLLFIAPMLSLLLGGMLFAPAIRMASAQETEAASTVRFVHAYVGGGPVDIYVDGEIRVQALEYGIATEFASFQPGDHSLQVVAAGQDASAPLLEDDFSTGDGEAFNAIVAGAGDEIELDVSEVDLDAIDQGMARYRFINASSDAGDLDVSIALGPDQGIDAAIDDDSNIDVTGIGFFDGQDYQNIEAGVYDFIVTAADSDDVRFETPDVRMDAGQVYDLLILGQSADSSLMIVPLVTAVSRPCSELLDVGSASDACVRFVHASPDAGDVDVYVGDDLIAQGLSFGQATSFTPVAASDQQIRIVPTGQSTDVAVLDEEFEFTAGQAHQVTVLGLATTDDDDDLRVREDEIDLTPLPENQVRVRFVQAVPEAGSVDLKLNNDIDLFDGAGFNEMRGYEVLDAGVYSVQVLQADDDNEVVVSATDVELTEGYTYDLFAIGRADDGSAQILILETNATVREGAQATPIAIEPGAEPADDDSVEIDDPDTVGGDEDTENEIDEAPVTPESTPSS